MNLSWHYGMNGGKWYEWREITWKLGNYWINMMTWIDKLGNSDRYSNLRDILWHCIGACHIQIINAQTTAHSWSYLRLSVFVLSLMFEASLPRLYCKLAIENCCFPSSNKILSSEILRTKDRKKITRNLSSPGQWMLFSTTVSTLGIGCVTFLCIFHFWGDCYRLWNVTSMK